ncbi:MAG: carbohydrate binding family 6, partial [Fibrobacteres bacterium]|nr:carbohydrate binding family 6 [Fibrobacterota bacterium]
MQMYKRPLIAKSIAIGLSLMPAMAVAANHAFDQNQGVLSVDYAGYLSKHNVVFNKPITDFMSGMTVGNGRVGAMVWNANGITAQVVGVDASPQACFSEGRLNLATSPRMDTNYTAFQQTLSLYDGTLTAQYDADRTVTFMGSPNSELLGIHVEDKRAGVKSVTFQVSMWDPNTQMTSTVNNWHSMQ